MKGNLAKGLTQIIFLLVCFPSFSGIIDTNDNSFIDTSTNLEWMDFGVNFDSYEYISTQLKSDGQYSGWSFANEQQVKELWVNSFLSIGLINLNSQTDNNNTVHITDNHVMLLNYKTLPETLLLWESTHRSMLSNQQGAITRLDTHWLFQGADGFQSSMEISTYLFIESTYDNRSTVTSGDWISPEDLFNDPMGIWSTMLVKSIIPVPEPLTLPLFALLLIFLLKTKRVYSK